MDENPFLSPTAETVGVISFDPGTLRGIARCRMGILVCAFLQVAIPSCAILLPRWSRILPFDPPNEITVVPVLVQGFLVVGVAAAVFVFVLAARLTNVWGIALGAFALVACVGFAALSIAVGKATAALAQGGIEGGSPGAARP